MYLSAAIRCGITYVRGFTIRSQAESIGIYEKSDAADTVNG